MIHIFYPTNPVRPKADPIVLPYPQDFVDNILVSIIISGAQGFTKSLKKSCSHQEQTEL